MEKIITNCKLNSERMLTSEIGEILSEEYSKRIKNELHFRAIAMRLEEIGERQLARTCRRAFYNKEYFIREYGDSRKIPVQSPTL